jgi:cysteine synthase A
MDKKSHFVLGILTSVLVYRYRREIRIRLYHILKCLNLKQYIPFYSKKLFDYKLEKSAKFNSQNVSCVVFDGVVGLVGNTPMIRLNSLSSQSGCTILAKLEYSNPGGSSKDRFALHFLENLAQEFDTIVEGTSGSTGISLSLFASLKGINSQIVVPSDICPEKQNLLRLFGADLQVVKPASISDPEMYVNVAKRMSLQENPSHKIAYADQFENPLNFQVHYEKTGPEIWYQTEGCIDAFVSGAGTGGTIAGVSKYLKEKDASILIIAADPQGSGIKNKVKYNVMYSSSEAEGTRCRNQVDSIIEGIGLNRNTKNLEKALIDDAYTVTDEEAIEMAKYLLKNEGLWVGSSTAVNCAAVMKLAKDLGPGHVIVTMLCDQGHRHLGKFWKLNKEQHE